MQRYRLDADDLSIFYSGSKGFHVGLPTSLWTPEPSATFNRLARRFAEHAAELLGIEIDASIYDKIRAFRAPNSRHPKTGRHKRRLTFDELLYLKATAIVKLAAEPEPFEFYSKKDTFRTVTVEDLPDSTTSSRRPMPALSTEERISSFAEVEQGYTPEDLKKEAHRCLECGCSALFECDLRKQATEYKVDIESFLGEATQYRVDRRHPLIQLDPNKFNVDGKGWDEPADPHDPMNQAKNRRVEIRVFAAEQE